jgi:hypothetical protein
MTWKKRPVATRDMFTDYVYVYVISSQFVTDGSILSVEAKPMDQWPSVEQGFYDQFSIPSIKKNQYY